MCIFFIAASTISVLPLSEIHQALMPLPIHRSIAAFILQLINQTMLLLDETGQIVNVLRLRGVSGIKGLRIILSFPVIWMVRILFRAERTAAAMTVRGYGIEYMYVSQKTKMSIADMLTAIPAGSIFFVALTLRLISLS
jgi:energy-coupling factor transporter transmembrane protein EcfT